jgi:hypothetical protein
MNYHFEDFEKCKYNPLHPNLAGGYPELKTLFDLTIPVQKVLRFAMACYQPNTPLKSDCPEWIKRKEAAAEIAGYDLEGDTRFLTDLFAGTDDLSMDVIHTFLRHCIHSRVWAMIVSNEETFWEYNQRLKRPISKAITGTGDKDEMAAIEKKSKLATDQEVFHERINRLTKEFFSGDEEVAEAAAQHFRMTPQQIAKQLSNT